MRRRSNRPPNPRSLLIVVGALQANVPSSMASHSFRESQNGVPNLRYAAETHGTPWVVDIYLGHFYRAQIGNQLGETFRTIPSLLGFLLHNLGVVPKPGVRTD